MTADSPTLPADPTTLGARTTAFLGRSFLHRLDELAGQTFTMAPPDEPNRSFAEFRLGLVADPRRVVEAQAKLWRDSFALWRNVLRGRRGGGLEP
ncbi:MAG: hypothetical protein GVY33_08895, partial [Alphaproteobacteria bacterium]|nr:hypothetical protein [Alphaproteobacteria bacterium]